MFVTDLIKLGFSKGESEIYACLLQAGDLSASEIAKRTNIGRTNVYEYANLLAKSGLVNQYEKNNKIFFRAEDPIRLTDIVEAKQREMRELGTSFREMLPKLTDMYNTNISKPLIKHFQSEVGYKELTDMVYIDSNYTQLAIVVPDLDYYTPPEPKFRNALLRKQVFTSIYANSGNIIEFNKRDQRELRRTQLIAESKLRIKTSMMLFADYYVFGKLNPADFSATLIRSKELVSMNLQILSNLVNPE